jgi:hypothetical protein
MRRPSSPALPALAARVAPVAAAAEGARMVRRRAEARELGRRRSTGRGGFGSGAGGECRGHGPVVSRCARAGRRCGLLRPDRQAAFFIRARRRGGM